MSEPNSRLSQLPVSRVRVAGATSLSERHLVYCQRRSATVSVGDCRVCPHFRSLPRAPGGELLAVVCDEAPSETHEATITLRRWSVGDLMTRDILCVRPDLPLETAAILLLEHPARPLPVVNESGRVLGTVSDCDVQLEIQTQRGESGTVIDALSPAAMCVPESTSLTRAAAVMAFEGVSCLIVLSPAGTVVGVLTAADLLGWLAMADGYLPQARSGVPR
jgi:CBS domain-containing protein